MQPMTFQYFVIIIGNYVTGTKDTRKIYVSKAA